VVSEMATKTIAGYVYKSEKKELYCGHNKVVMIFFLKRVKLLFKEIDSRKYSR
jgi:hypothetical protein